ncbi:MAG: ABC transporter permease, partial [Methylococcaceae bacterium]
SRRLLRTAQFIEFSALGLISGVMAMVMSELMLLALYTQVLHISYHPSFYLWLLVPLTNALLISVVGCWGVRQVLNKPPLQVLRAL